MILSGDPKPPKNVMKVPLNKRACPKNDTPKRSFLFCQIIPCMFGRIQGKTVLEM